MSRGETVRDLDNRNNNRPGSRTSIASGDDG
jgi:hypothetical protein